MFPNLYSAFPDLYSDPSLNKLSFLSQALPNGTGTFEKQQACEQRPAKVRRINHEFSESGNSLHNNPTQLVNKVYIDLTKNLIPVAIKPSTQNTLEKVYSCDGAEANIPSALNYKLPIKNKNFGKNLENALNGAKMTCMDLARTLYMRYPTMRLESMRSLIQSVVDNKKMAIQAYLAQAINEILNETIFVVPENPTEDQRVERVPITSEECQLLGMHMLRCRTSEAHLSSLINSENFLKRKSIDHILSNMDTSAVSTNMVYRISKFKTQSAIPSAVRRIHAIYGEPIFAKQPYVAKVKDKTHYIPFNKDAMRKLSDLIKKCAISEETVTALIDKHIINDQWWSERKISGEINEYDAYRLNTIFDETIFPLND